MRQDVGASIKVRVANHVVLVLIVTVRGHQGYIIAETEIYAQFARCPPLIHEVEAVDPTTVFSLHGVTTAGDLRDT